ncbi:hypothetical protein EV2_046534 [Malus domestica]
MTAPIVPTLLNRKNYESWSSRIESYLLAEDLWDIVEHTYDFENEALRKKDVKALYAIKNSCGDDTYKLIKDLDSAKDAWDTLSENFKIGYNRYNQSSDEIDKRTILQAYPTPTPTPTDRDARPELAMEEGHTGGHDESNANNIHETFVKYVGSKDWDKAIKFLRQHRQLRSARIFNGTALHFAVKRLSKCSVRNIEELVDLMEKEDLEIQDIHGYTALYHLVRENPEMVEVAKRMVAKNHNLLTNLPDDDTQNPLVIHAEWKEKGERMARYLYSFTRETLRVVDGAELISLGFLRRRFDIVWDLIQRYPQLAVAKDYNGDIPLATLANNRSAFLSGSRLNLWEKLIYYGIRIKPLLPIKESDQSDQRHLSNQKENQGPLSNQNENQRHLNSSVMGLFRGLVTNLQKILGINHIYEMKLMHERVQQFLPLMCKATKNTDETKAFNAALCVAAERGHVEYITHFCRNELNDESFPIPVSFITSKNYQSLFQIAAECRHHKVYNLIYVLYELFHEQDNNASQGPIQDNVGWRNYFGNNMLHTVASITPLSQIDHIRGAALQMQRELQWFKEVESHAYPKDREHVNGDNMTPREIFMENHKEMGKEAEKSMKETSTSCTVVGALIVTIMFAAAFTVPGGNDENTGLPKFLTKKVFTTFIVSDAISLFSSTTSVIMFLGILTSRYSENDFHKSLPTKMIIGLFTLFLSIATMMIVFSCALYIMLDGKPSIVIPIILLASVPIASFIWMQFPLLVALIISTFGRGIFDKKPYKKSLNSSVVFT